MDCKACGLPIDDHVAGRKLDACVAEAVFEREPMNGRHGLHSNGDIEYHWGYPVGHSVAGKYSTDIAAAWEAVEKLSRENWAWHIEQFWVDGKTRWWILFWGDDGDGNIFDDDAFGDSESVPHAICLASLKAVTND